ncbi:replication initiation protein [Citreicella sp. C3M06]|uniref:plasmid replication protein RepC n=1 Tax=Citreicella sp. C3M06 TaxID=2841564 RepID=UPI001C0A4537|nr:plasmid replication protein RepC [Citreicella sp. C3M06]MBU2959937.1 replication initiation protein [Citreicella sp. C3M06]
MDYTPISPFQRPLTCAHLTDAAGPEPLPEPMPELDKWALFRELTVARDAFGVSSRELTVLQALLSFHPSATLGRGPMVVFPSNRAICERLNGMACSTMRRHLSRLVDAGLLIRRDSPNGKRYVRRGAAVPTAFGFDLSPLPRMSARILSAADAAREAERALRAQRETVSLMRRDLAALLALADAHGVPDAPLADLCLLTAKALRRKLTVEMLDEIQAELTAAIDGIQRRLAPVIAADSGSSDAQNEQHQQRTDIDHSVPVQQIVENPAQDRTLLCLTENCPSLATFNPEPIQSWPDLHAAADRLCASMGIDRPAWEEARQRMGATHASVAVVSMLERFSEIRSPGAYLRALAKRAMEGRFDGAGMIAALAKRRACLLS